MTHQNYEGHGPRDIVPTLLLGIAWCCGTIFFLLSFIYTLAFIKWLGPDAITDTLAHAWAWLLAH